MTTFYAIEEINVPWRAEIDQKIADYNNKNKLRGFQGKRSLKESEQFSIFIGEQLQENDLVLAPFEDGAEVSYHRALVLAMSSSGDSYIKFVDYGDFKNVKTSQLRQIPNEKVNDII